MDFAEIFSQRIRAGEDRFDLIRDFVHWWYDPFQFSEADGNSEDEICAAEEDIGLRLPGALRRWYGLCGRRLDDLTFQDTPLTLEDLSKPNGEIILFVFYCENQGVVLWGIRPSDFHLADPPVYLYMRPGILELYSKTTSNFLLASIVYEAAFASFDKDIDISGLEMQNLTQIMNSIMADEPISSHWPRQLFSGECNDANS